MFKSSSQHTSDEDRSPRQMQQRGGEANLPLGSPACEAITPRSRMNPPTPSTASPPPAGGSGHTASTAVAADRLLGEEPISSTDINASAMATAAPDVVDERHPARYPGYEGVNTSDSRVRVTEYFEGGVVEGKPNEGKPRLALLFDGPEHEYQDEYKCAQIPKSRAVTLMSVVLHSDSPCNIEHFIILQAADMQLLHHKYCMLVRCVTIFFLQLAEIREETHQGVCQPSILLEMHIRQLWGPTAHSAPCHWRDRGAV